ncbi:MAG: hypothetical protein Kow0029_21780 [Candidatus Rifleibacteriota bacterium]
MESLNHEKKPQALQNLLSEMDLEAIQKSSQNDSVSAGSDYAVNLGGSVVSDRIQIHH